MKATRYSSRYIQEMGLIEVICNYKKRLAPRVGLEPTTLRLTADGSRRISKLYGVLPRARECHKGLQSQGLQRVAYHSVSLGRVRWWAQNWATVADWG